MPLYRLTGPLRQVRHKKGANEPNFRIPRLILTCSATAAERCILQLQIDGVLTNTTLTKVLGRLTQGIGGSDKAVD